MLKIKFVMLGHVCPIWLIISIIINKCNILMKNSTFEQGFIRSCKKYASKQDRFISE